MPSPYLLGIDTGGTYTDAVLFREAEGVLAKAKSLTTRHDLSQGIAGAVEGVLAESGVSPAEIGMVSLSTTLATNALVEGQGGSVALVMIGFTEADLERGGLKEALGRDPVVYVPGGHDVHGNEQPLDLSALEKVVALAPSVSAFAVAGYFAVRDPSHELRVREHLREATGLPVTCSHELTSKLGGPRRALTTLLNARLVPVIDRLIEACQGFLRSSGIEAPLMVVRGDGALISASEARSRPIETILSGPAASLVGARHLTGLHQAVVSDIGGTTTDVAVLEDGLPRLAEEGAIVGGHRTLVEAVALETFGLGGDSEVRIDDLGLKAEITLGPRRVLPLSLIAHDHPDIVLPALERQLKAARSGRHDGRFAVATGVELGIAAHALKPHERALLEQIGIQPKPLNVILQSASQQAALDLLVTRGLVHLSAITPTDALHVLKRQDQWNAQAAQLGFALAARHRDGAGRAIAESAEMLADAVVARLTRQSAEAVLATCLDENGNGVEVARSPLIGHALERAPGVVRFSIALDRPLIGLGASAPIYYPGVAQMLGAEAVIPVHADVANAVGAVVGQVRSVVTVVVTAPGEGRYVVSGMGEPWAVEDEAEALALARERARKAALEKAAAAGADQAVVTLSEELDRPEVEGSARLLEARVVATAVGRPRVALP
ncbi:N-methylhydantoinase A/oxoprolinase/acetone carboxylase beta subunit [Pseudorhizobium tarimense]|uniref:N-methylhydantoinase A/oxoprolinase/acetone carboxylase beta subunit n=1 Tax=Pseudorhizobium tarimense TaxID=1079109 RepID=A0ABV2H8E1_9HYPH|nr:hydantoinase/oxoprolinase family protein [Pseudorhizobium tarimense]MCJ8519776.1 hydantoinase/oxoprolinase family protein [Pseudorhizobium tarimense]